MRSQELREAAEQAAQMAYAPYSRLHVGAALRSTSGAVYAGCNVENGALPIGFCAERAAISAAVLQEGPEFRLDSIAVIAYDSDGRLMRVPPCGACRQALNEFGPEARVGFVGAGDQWIEVAARELLPHGFVLPDDL